MNFQPFLEFLVVECWERSLEPGFTECGSMVIPALLSIKKQIVRIQINNYF